MTKLWSDNKTSDDIDFHAKDDSDNVIYNLCEDLTVLREAIQTQAKLIESLLYGVDEAVSTIALHEHNDNALILCESDLRELSLVVSEELDKL